MDPLNPSSVACLLLSLPNSCEAHLWISSGYGIVENSPTAPWSHCLRITLYLRAEGCPGAVWRVHYRRSGGQMCWGKPGEARSRPLSARRDVRDELQE